MTRPVPTLGPISLKLNRHDCLVVLIICWKVEENQLKIDEVMNYRKRWKRKTKKNNKKKKRQNENRKVSD